MNKASNIKGVFPTLQFINQLTVIDEYTRHGEVAGICVMTSILVMRKKQ